MTNFDALEKALSAKGRLSNLVGRKHPSLSKQELYGEAK